jgi:uncharacterized protein YeeX (DUF496 family)
MKTLIFCSLLLITAFNFFVNDAQANKGQVSLNQEIITFFDNYMQHYNDYIKDTSNTDALKQMAATYHKSAFQVISGVPISPLDNPDELAKGAQRFLDSLVAQGVAKIKWQKVNIELLTDVSAYASNVGVRYKKDGQIFNKAAADYLLVKTAQGWKIAVLVLRSIDEIKKPKQLKEVKQFIATYLKNYNDTIDDDGAYNNETMPSLLAASKDLSIPAINISAAGNFLLFTSNKQVADDTRTFIFDLKTQDVIRIVYEKIQVKMLTESTALASNIASINKSGNSTLFKIGVTYLINKTDQGWKIIARTIHPADSILRIN